MTSLSGRIPGGLPEDGAFETLLVMRGVPFALTRHVARLCDAAITLGMPSPDAGEVARRVREAAGSIDAERGRLRVTWTRSGEGEPHLHVTAAPVDARATSAVALMVDLPVVSTTVNGIKDTDYSLNAIALRRARRGGAHEALLPTTDAHLCEGATSNLLLLLDGRWVTPPLGDGPLPGITRALALQWLPVSEASIAWHDVTRADAAVLASSVRGLHAVEAIIDPDGRRHSVSVQDSHALGGRFLELMAMDPDP